jgi:hypothetical protein
MHLVQLFLPLSDNTGRAFDKALFDAVRRMLAERFGGSTAFMRTPASGLWEDAEGELERDDVMLVETLVDALDRDWWNAYRRTLEKEFRQHEILVRALPVETL